ncbi:MAG: hypothetical protein A2315_06505 [Ignavibacteria bacterium RIFOXYB2_FULL_35_12]|nr:MAG: hypothetical protein A2058_01725 [Ignavibacteria bacterium GWA2_36_19]OGU50439.1 MAG: hypothetical protein A2006_04195 [Ignavibacteria bacterium GWC2_35_8]OGU58785.1 MAG: hypothetical protein A2X60_11255 [Ignavibacteria bacterium GWF2_35_20]OGU78146.1 MAG: hypothetical protein A2254_10035 [Ignavibacteria bacterium RIFOXYA2_FULL_35_9]OGU91333.1 MAG: hypothetical protein A3K31_08255 [Ignavibacteria bacterium RIFOXYA12_FULL_35_25]OGU94412.1 MAG: hypothetical protein A2347_13480 [Ignavibac
MWVIYAVLNPFIDASRNVFSKKASLNVDSLVVSWVNNFVPFLLFLPVVFFIELKFNQQFIISVIISGTINTAAAILYHRAISQGEISVVVPMLSFTPLFLLVISPIIVGEFPTSKGFIGIILIVVGSYLLNVNLKEKGILFPLKSLMKNKATRYMLIVAFIWSISANFDKKGIEASSILQYILFINLFVTIGTTIFVISKGKFSLQSVWRERKNLFFVGALTSLGYFVHMTALAMTLVAYVIALKRTSGMITVVLGYLILKEQNIKERLLGSTIMFLGVLFIVLF